jgi:two-component system sensor histidine kinase SenX3
LYYIQVPAHGAPQAQRLTTDGHFAAAPLPEWITASRCDSSAVERPPALVAPLFNEVMEARVIKTFNWRPSRCFVASFNTDYLRNALFPQLIQQSFGATAVRDYDFTVVSRNRPSDAFYGKPTHADLRQPFFSLAPKPLKPPLPDNPKSKSAVFFVRQITVNRGKGQIADLLGPGIWELDVAHKNMPLAAAFEQQRRRDLLLSAGVELLLIAAIVFLVIGARRMQKLADRKMQFVAGVSHELRTPVSAIAMLSRNQADGLVTGAEKVKQYGELIHQQSRRLNEMVEQALQYAGIHSGLRRAPKDEINVRRVLEEAVNARREELARSGFEIVMAVADDLPPVRGDEQLLRMAFDNLLSNAQKHAERGRWIRVTAEYDAPEKEIRISVEDRGAGIDPVDQAEIFEPFSRGRKAIEAQIPGSGLGLSLVRSTAELHRGSITLVSEPGRGSTFTLHLPV